MQINSFQNFLFIRKLNSVLFKLCDALWSSKASKNKHGTRNNLATIRLTGLIILKITITIQILY
jgi:hypothetical protein